MHADTSLSISLPGARFCRSVANMGDKYKRGVPELGLPSLDPMSMPKIEIQMGNNKVKMEDITSSGFTHSKT